MPSEKATEASLIDNIDIYGANDLKSVINHLNIKTENKGGGEKKRKSKKSKNGF